MINPTSQLPVPAGAQQYAYDVLWTQTPSASAVADNVTVNGRRYLGDGSTNTTWLGDSVPLVRPADLAGSDAAAQALAAAIPSFKALIAGFLAARQTVPSGAYVFRIARTIRVVGGAVKIALAIYTRGYTVAGGVVTLGAELCEFATTDLTAIAAKDANVNTLAGAGATLDAVIQAWVTARGL